ncbi:aquaporin [Gryllotalpicola protaetiae]|uniref:Aquaporin family protein n=1 Tax=Gryllotalpicola protaetiae TaxID=2419771 RepID=A0A387BWN2_9MICO|nr:aquaporin [Gryllotalpicola protaetiae]AYG05319.1 aquaporin family protein [Gryllotalpicola protaetiae]
MTSHPALWRRATAEFLGTGLLVAIVAGSGIAAQQLSPHDVGLELMENSIATALGLAVLILMLGPISGAHFNPVVTLSDALLGGRSWRETLVYLAAQITGGIGGAGLANAMFGTGYALSTKHRSTAGHLIGEVVATAILILLIFLLARTGQTAAAPAAIGAYIGAAYWFTSSTSFANPAVTLGRMFTDTFAGIAPASAPGFLVAQLVGAAAGLGLLVILVPAPRLRAADAIVPERTLS